mgnify:CR=1 FL=1
MEIIDYLIFAFLGWAAYDTIKDEGWVDGFISIIIIVCVVLAVVLIPHFFGEIGKKTFLVLLIIVACYAGIKKFKKISKK